VDRDPHGDRPLRRDLLVDHAWTASRRTTRTAWWSTSTPSSTSGTSTIRRPAPRPRELHVPVDRQIEFRMHALDVIHLVLGAGVADQEGRGTGDHHPGLHHAQRRAQPRPDAGLYRALRDRPLDDGGRRSRWSPRRRPSTNGPRASRRSRADEQQGEKLPSGPTTPKQVRQ